MQEQGEPQLNRELRLLAAPLQLDLSWREHPVVVQAAFPDGDAPGALGQGPQRTESARVADLRVVRVHAGGEGQGGQSGQARSGKFAACRGAEHLRGSLQPRRAGPVAADPAGELRALHAGAREHDFPHVRGRRTHKLLCELHLRALPEVGPDVHQRARGAEAGQLPQPQPPPRHRCHRRRRRRCRLGTATGAAAAARRGTRHGHVPVGLAALPLHRRHSLQPSLVIGIQLHLLTAVPDQVQISLRRRRIRR
mmetsp:Transcript_90282/g.291950  ORF Transcript_90282/g.291950 Transcript_90282/m.291950 type:complete len:252 (-) Transcript_90282:508-1263(-)